MGHTWRHSAVTTGLAFRNNSWLVQGTIGDAGERPWIHRVLSKCPPRCAVSLAPDVSVKVSQNPGEAGDAVLGTWVTDWVNFSSIHVSWLGALMFVSDAGERSGAFQLRKCLGHPRPTMRLECRVCVVTRV